MGSKSKGTWVGEERYCGRSFRLLPEGTSYQNGIAYLYLKTSSVAGSTIILPHYTDRTVNISIYL